MSQTNNCDLFKNLQDQIVDLTAKLAASEKINTKIIQDRNRKESQATQLQSAHTTLMGVSSIFNILLSKRGCKLISTNIFFQYKKILLH